ncbi:MAG: hypothetical protein NVS2B3_01200 [Vulcanimicrobiaceae bacterium]
MWSDVNFGFPEAFWANTTPLWAAVGPLEAHGTPYAIVERVLWLWPYAIGAPICGYVLCYRLTRNPVAAAGGAMLFALNTFSIGLIERGHIPALDAFILIGLIVPQSIDFSGHPSWRRALVLAASMSFQALYEVRYAYESVLVLTLFCVLALPRLARSGGVPNLLRSGAVCAIAMVAFNLHFILPTIVIPPGAASLGSLDSFRAISHFGSLLSALSLYYPFYHWYVGRDGFVDTPVDLPFVAVAGLAWIGLLVHRKRRAARLLVALSIVGIVLASETKSPFAAVNEASFAHFPGFSLFRDFTKFYAFVVPGYALGVAYAIVATTALVRSHFPRTTVLRFAVPTLWFVAYGLTMRDAVNPLRHSNFARAVEISSAGEATEAYLRAKLGDARVLMFPGDTRVQRRTDTLDSADATAVATNALPSGLAFLNSGASASDALFSLFDSPLAPALLSELRVRFVVVPDDPELYFAFDGRPARWASIDFLHQRSWLHEVARFGDNVVFETAEAPVEPAFFAPYPVEVLGAPATAEGLVGSRLWSNRSALLVDEQMPKEATWLQTVPNVVQGATLIDPISPIGLGGAVETATRLHDAVVAERYNRRSFSGSVFSSAMLSTTLGQWNLDSPFAFRFRTSYRAAATATFLLEPRKRVPSVLVRKSGDVYSADRKPASATSARVICRQDRIWRDAFETGSNDVIRMTPGDAVKELTIRNPCPVAYRGDVGLRITSGDLLPSQISIGIGALERTIVAPPDWTSLSGDTVVLSDVLLRPGVNSVQIGVASKRPATIRADYAISNLNAVGRDADALPLDLTTRRSEAGDLLYASIDTARFGLHVGYVDFFGPLQLPLDRHPVCTLKYTMSDVPATFDLVLDLRDRSTGELISIWVPTALKEDHDWDIYALVRDVEREASENESADRVGDFRWLAAHSERQPKRPDDFALLGVRMATSWPVGKSTALPRQTFVGLLAGARLVTSDRNVGSRWTYPQSHAVRVAGVGERDFALRGMKLLRVDAVDGGHTRVAAQLESFTPSGYRLAASIRVGDYVKLSLQNEKSAQGTIVADSAEYVVIQDGDGVPERIARASIAAVTAQTITRSARVDIPISTPFEPTNLQFNVRSDANLRVRVALEYANGNGSKETIAAVDHDATDRSGVDVEPDFVHPSIPSGTSVFDLDLPIDLSVSRAASERSTSYDIDLWDVERYRFGGSRHRLVGLELAFTEAPDADVASREYSLAVEDLTTSRDRFLSGSSANAAVGKPLMQIDDRSISLTEVDALSPSSRYLVGRNGAGTLEAGDHIVTSLPVDEVSVRAAMLARGEPSSFLNGNVRRFEVRNRTEAVGDLSGAGLMVVSRLFDPGWALAIFPQDVPAPPLTGFALFDWFRCRRYFVPAADHVAVTTSLDGWYVPPGPPGSRSFAMVYSPEAFNELGFALSLFFFVSCGALVVVRRESKR